MRRVGIKPSALLACSLITTLGAVACLKAPTDTSLQTLPTTETDIAGSFNLVAVNSQALPITTQVTPDTALQVQAERIVIAANNTWADTSTVNFIDLTTGDTTAHSSIVSAGSAQITGGTIQFVTTIGSGATFVGSVRSDTLYVVFGGARSVYVR